MGLNAGFNIIQPTTGSYNTYLGTGAGSSTNGLLTNGSNNVFVGYAAGNNESNVSNNIEIGNSGPTIETPGNNQILIGNASIQTDTYIAGINSSTPGTQSPVQAVCVDGYGNYGASPQGQTASSRRAASRSRSPTWATALANFSSCAR